MREGQEVNASTFVPNDNLGFECEMPEQWPGPKQFKGPLVRRVSLEMKLCE